MTATQPRRRNTAAAGDTPIPVLDPPAPGTGLSNRYQNLIAEFQSRYGALPQAVSRAPGRLNLIGEHLDYEGYGVLPMAVQQDCLVAVRLEGTCLQARSTAPEHADFNCLADPAQEIDVSRPVWGNYFVAAYKGVHDYLKAKHLDHLYSIPGAKVLVDGNVPPGTGLSSSSAFVVASVIALLAALGLPPPGQQEVADLCCSCEKYVGTMGGGMDQAASVMSKAGYAKFVEFNPLRAEDVQLPSGATFVIANSLTTCHKASATQFNMRVVECRLAAMVLAAELGVAKGEALKEIKMLRDVEGAVQARLGSGEGEVHAGLGKLLHEKPYSQDELEQHLGAPLSELLAEEEGALRTIAMAVADKGPECGVFELLPRAMHTYSEAARVLKFKETCQNSSLSEPEVLARLGQLMDASHSSCNMQYDCSSPELNQLVGAARVAGAIGARLTGAGWGGCIVALVASESVDDFIAQLKTTYYAKYVKAGDVDEASLDNCVFPSKPGPGAYIFKMESPEAGHTNGHHQ